MNDFENKYNENKNKRKKARWWSFLWSNVVMGIVLLLTYLFQRYLYMQMAAHTLVEVDINPLVIAGGYIVGMLLLWLIIFKYETKEDELFDDFNNNHNIY